MLFSLEGNKLFESCFCSLLLIDLTLSMEDNEYSLGVTEDSSSHVSYGQGSDETGQGGDSSMLIEGGFSGKC